ncbi:hypothetical protein BDZ89DRAFT_1149692 [Hymenopellis radicata]|nr:hypothetical protein BDZ89DRAFT_1149692 [Hymenopellis radicata]
MFPKDERNNISVTVEDEQSNDVSMSSEDEQSADISMSAEHEQSDDLIVCATSGPDRYYYQETTLYSGERLEPSVLLHAVRMAEELIILEESILRVQCGISYTQGLFAFHFRLLHYLQCALCDVESFFGRPTQYDIACQFHGGCNNRWELSNLYTMTIDVFEGGCNNQRLISRRETSR